jgi:uncharacterized membrane protein YukC
MDNSIEIIHLLLRELNDIKAILISSIKKLENIDSRERLSLEKKSDELRRYEKNAT